MKDPGTPLGPDMQLLEPLASERAPARLWISISDTVARRRDAARRRDIAWRAAACIVGLLFTVTVERTLARGIVRREAQAPLSETLGALAHAHVPWREVREIDRVQRQLITLAVGAGEEHDR